MSLPAVSKSKLVGPSGSACLTIRSVALLVLVNVQTMSSPASTANETESPVRVADVPVHVTSLSVQPEGTTSAIDLVPDSSPASSVSLWLDGVAALAGSVSSVSSLRPVPPASNEKSAGSDAGSVTFT